jgi:hypothetical protein
MINKIYWSSLDAKKIPGNNNHVCARVAPDFLPDLRMDRLALLDGIHDRPVDVLYRSLFVDAGNCSRGFHRLVHLGVAAK